MSVEIFRFGRHGMEAGLPSLASVLPSCNSFYRDEEFDLAPPVRLTTITMVEGPFLVPPFEIFLNSVACCDNLYLLQ